jgi:phosphopantothenoylcysteine decarboxylase/phosphopantothenate--cysteine ligase
MMTLSGKTVLLGVTGGIAAFKAAQLTSNLKKQGAEVFVLMTKNATQFVTPLTFETLSNNKACIDTFDRNFQWNVEHIALAKRADVVVVAPATANVIAKLAHGLADDMLTTTILAARCPKIICPAMNTGMYENAATQRNLEQLRQDGFLFVEPGTGFLAEGGSGKGRLAELAEIEEAIAAALRSEQDLSGLRVTGPAGPPQESFDPVRFITNHSSGKMGYAIAAAAAQRGAVVTLVSGPVALEAPKGVTVVRITSAQQMFETCRSLSETSEVIIKAAAVADYTRRRLPTRR